MNTALNYNRKFSFNYYCIITNICTIDDVEIINKKGKNDSDNNNDDNILHIKIEN